MRAGGRPARTSGPACTGRGATADASSRLRRPTGSAHTPCTGSDRDPAPIMAAPSAPRRTGVDRLPRSSGEPEDQPERPLRPRPELADQLLAARADEAAEHE